MNISNKYENIMDISDKYEKKIKLQNAFNSMELPDQIDYDDNDLMQSNKIEDIVNPISNKRIVKERKTVFTVNSINRDEYINITLEKNVLTGLYSSDTLDASDNLITIIYTADILNNLFIATGDDIIRPYYQDGDLIKKRIYKYKDPSKYTVELSKKYINIKSLRLLSVEIPNTINNITEFNNIIMIDIIDNNTNNSIPLKPGKSPVNYIILQLDIGHYNIEDLILKMNTKINTIVNDYNDLGLTNIFEITYDNSSGRIDINLVNYAPYNLAFHLKFWFSDKQTEYLDLWYMLGFSYYHELNSDGSDKYVITRNNLFNYGNNSLLNFNRPEFNILKPYKWPNLNPVDYIYLIIKNINYNIIDNNKHIDNIFGKIIFNVPYGEFTTSFVNTPVIFDTTLISLHDLHIEWRDYCGNLVNFQNNNHSLTFEIIEYIDELEETNMNTRRGIYDKQYYPSIIKNN